MGMNRRVPDGDEEETSKQFDCSLLGLSVYPDPEDGLEEVLGYVLHEVVPREVKKHATHSTAVFLTRDPVSPLWRDVNPAATKAPGFLCVVRAVAHDALFYLASVLRADGFVYMFERDTAEQQPLYAVWDRMTGLEALVHRDGQFEKVPSASVRHILPPTISGEGDVVH